MLNQTADTGVYNQDMYYYNHNTIINYRSMVIGSVLIEQDISADDGFVNVYTDSLCAHGAVDGFIPYEMYKNGGFVITVKTNSSQPDELFYETKGNMTIHLRFANNIAATQVVYLIGIAHTTYKNHG